MKKALATVLSITALLTGCYDTGSGNKNGVVTKLAKQGIFCKTWEGQIIRGGFSGGSGVNGAAFDFTIESDELAKKVQELADSRKEVKITYRTELWTLCRSDSDNHFLVSIEELKPRQEEATEASVATPSGNKQDKIIELLKVQGQLLQELTGDQR